MQLSNNQTYTIPGASDLFISDEILSKEDAALLKTVSLVAGDAGRPVRLTDNFFDIGGNSLNAVAVVTKLRDQGFHLSIS